MSLGEPIFEMGYLRDYLELANNIWRACRVGSYLGAGQMASQYVHPNGTHSNFGQFWRKWPKTHNHKNPQMCLLGAHTRTPLSEREGLTIPQNTPKFHDLTLISRKVMINLSFGAELGTTFL